MNIKNNLHFILKNVHIYFKNIYIINIHTFFIILIKVKYFVYFTNNIIYNRTILIKFSKKELKVILIFIKIINC